MVKKNEMKILGRLNIFGWLAIVFGGLVGIIALLMVQSFWMDLDVNTQLVIFGLFVTMFVAVASKATLKKVR